MGKTFGGQHAKPLYLSDIAKDKGDDMREVRSRDYTAVDRDACLNVFDTNVPNFFAPEERAMFTAFLDGPVLKRPYLVLDTGKDIIACGGLKVLETKGSAFLSWGMVARPCHGRGVGRMLTQARLNLARQTAGITTVTLNTSQHTKGFYEKFGFVPVKVTPNGYGPDLDRWDMLLELI